MSCGHDVKEAEDLLREWLGACGLPTGSRLPSVRILSGQLGIRYYPLNRAMTNLAVQGLVDRQGYKLFIAGKRAPEKSLYPCDVVVARRSIYLPSYRKVAKEMGIQATILPVGFHEELVAILKRLLHERSPGVVFAPPSEAYSAPGRPSRPSSPIRTSPWCAWATACATSPRSSATTTRLSR